MQILFQKKDSSGTRPALGRMPPLVASVVLLFMSGGVSGGVAGTLAPFVVLTVFAALACAVRVECVPAPAGVVSKPDEFQDPSVIVRGLYAVGNETGAAPPAANPAGAASHADPNRAMDETGLSEKQFLDIVEVFRLEYPKRLAALAERLAGAGREDAWIEVHTLKGLAKTVGAYFGWELAVRLERAVRGRCWDEAQNLALRLSEELAGAMAALDAWRDSRPKREETV